MSVLDSTGLREHAHATLEQLRSQTSCTISLAVLNKADIVYVDRVRSFRQGQGESDLGPGSVNDQELTADLNATAAPLRDKDGKALAQLCLNN